MKSILAYFDKPLLKVSLVFGLITGILAFAFFLGLYALKIMPLGNIRAFDMGVFIILISGACWYYRKTYGNGFLHLWEALTMGYVITCVAAILNGWLIYLFITHIDPSVFTDYITAGLELLTNNRKDQLSYLSESEFMKLYNEVRNNDPSIVIKNEISQKLLLAIIPILIITLIFRKQDYGVFHNKS